MLLEKRFANNLPGIEFVHGFLNQHHELTVRFGENINRVRTGVTSKTINLYFNELQKSLENVSPSSIVNYNESNFSDNPCKQKLVVKRGAKHPENIIDSSSKSNISVMMAGSADGVILPPYVVYRAEHLYPTWTENGPIGTRYNRSKSRWFDEKIFENWFDTLLCLI